MNPIMSRQSSTMFLFFFQISPFLLFHFINDHKNKYDRLKIHFEKIQLNKKKSNKTIICSTKILSHTIVVFNTAVRLWIVLKK